MAIADFSPSQQILDSWQTKGLCDTIHESMAPYCRRSVSRRRPIAARVPRLACMRSAFDEGLD
jgi:hypothetical protein